jgi:hypothetical protein
MAIWFLRRRPPLWARILRLTWMIGSATGVAVGAEILRRRFGFGGSRVEMERNGRTTRVRVSVPRSKAGRRKRRPVASRS